jgi:hypothetical protein
MWSARQIAQAMISVAVLLIVAQPVGAKATDQQKCAKGRHEAAGKYETCERGLWTRWYGGAFPDSIKFERALSKCREKYAATFVRLQKKARGTGTACDAFRFVDNGDGTIFDSLTGLQWEKKDNLDGSANPPDPHDADNIYSWSATGTLAEGTAYTSFLSALNSGGCFASQCDWRLPSILELHTVLADPFPCAGSPCIAPEFGPTVASAYSSSTTVTDDPSVAWLIDFTDGFVLANGKISGGYMRAVRGGL